MVFAREITCFKTLVTTLDKYRLCIFLFLVFFCFIDKNLAILSIMRCKILFYLQFPRPCKIIYTRFLLKPKELISSFHSLLDKPEFL